MKDWSWNSIRKYGRDNNNYKPHAFWKYYHKLRRREWNSTWSILLGWELQVMIKFNGKTIMELTDGSYPGKNTHCQCQWKRRRRRRRNENENENKNQTHWTKACEEEEKRIPVLWIFIAITALTNGEKARWRQEEEEEKRGGSLHTSHRCEGWEEEPSRKRERKETKGWAKKSKSYGEHSTMVCDRRSDLGLSTGMKRASLRQFLFLCLSPPLFAGRREWLFLSSSTYRQTDSKRTYNGSV